MAKAWNDYSALSAALSLANDDLLARDKSDTTDNATHGTVLRLPIDGLLGLSGITPGGRLTLESGVSVSTSNQTAKGTIYYTPDKHDYIRLYDGTRPKLYQFSELSLALTVTAGSNYDVFCYDNSGSLALELSSAWTNDTTRANALAWQAGVGWVKSGSPTRLLLGSLRGSASNQTQLVYGGVDSAPSILIWNAYNRVPIRVWVGESNDSWTYTTATWRQWRASSVMQANLLCGLVQPWKAMAVGLGVNTGAAGLNVGIGVDTTSSKTGITGFAATTQNLVATAGGLFAAGYHYLAALEYSAASGTTTWYGDAGSPTSYQTGLTVDWEY